jgi:hypothetical protein
MDAIVVYESLWGNTAEVARAVAEGLGPGARALRVDEAAAADVAGAGPLLPLLCTWLEVLAPGSGWGAAFDTQVRGPFGKGAPEIARLLEAAGYAPLAEPQGFVVKGRHGPLKGGEAERARAWGAELARAIESLRSA